jgi:hypothetical protein
MPPQPTVFAVVTTVLKQGYYHSHKIASLGANAVVWVQQKIGSNTFNVLLNCLLWPWLCQSKRENSTTLSSPEHVRLQWQPQQHFTILNPMIDKDILLSWFTQDCITGGCKCSMQRRQFNNKDPSHILRLIHVLLYRNTILYSLMTLLISKDWLKNCSPRTSILLHVQ